MPASSTVAAQRPNFGASINIISGIQGVSPGGQASVNMPTANRIHRETFQCNAVAYGLSGAISVVPAIAGTETFSGVVVNGVVTTINITHSATAKADGVYNLTITDHAYTDLAGRTVFVGTGATGTYTVASGVVTSVAITSGGTSGPVPPELFFTSIKHQVNGTIMRDIPPSDVLKIALANSYTYSTNEFPVFFTEPWRRIVDHDQATSWDLFGQSTYQILFGIAGNITSPTLGGTFEFDYLRNQRRGPKGDTIFFLRPIKQHLLTFQVPAGVFPITTIPVDFPIQRIWLRETGPGSITQVELYQDGNKVVEGTNVQNNEMLNQYGFNTSIYDYSIVFDPDQRLGKALNVENLILRVYSAAPTALNVIVESQLDNYV